LPTLSAQSGAETRSLSVLIDLILNKNRQIYCGYVQAQRINLVHYQAHY